MFRAVTVHASDMAASRRFYDTVLGVVGGRQDQFALADGGEAVTRRLHIAFAVSGRDDVDAFWRAGTRAGFRDDGPPGPRPQYRHDYYGAFLLDPDRNSVEAVHHGAVGERGTIAHSGSASRSWMPRRPSTSG